MSLCVTFSVPGRVDLPRRTGAGYHEREKETQAYLQGWAREAFYALTNTELVNNKTYTNDELRQIADLIEKHWRIMISRRVLPNFDDRWLRADVKWSRSVIYFYLAMWRLLTREFAACGGTMYTSW